MTISYSGEVANGSSFGSFWKILWKVRGSVYKLVWRELLVFLCLYYAINLTYRYGLNEGQQKTFERLRKYFESQSETIPMSFVLGFYVSLVVKRFFEQHRLLPWPDTLAIFISAAIPGNHEMGRLMRRNIMRYMMLSYVITMQQISLRVKKRFPSWNHLVDAGLVLESERKIFEIMDSKSPMSKYWMPLVWATNIINRARKEGLITSDQIVQTLLMELSDIRRRLSSLIGYDNVCVPLVYTQVVTLVLYSYFLSALMGRQMVPVPLSEADISNNIHEDLNLYFPLFTVLQFCFYVGWLKVAEVLINPFGEDDDDLELNWLIDRHIKASYMIVDEMHEEHPELLRDQYFEEVVPKDLPYTVAAEHYRREEPKGSAEHYKVKESEALYSNLERKSLHDVYYESIDTPMVERRKGRFSRQATRLGSGRSSSTTYSGLFGVNRMNFLYSKSEKDKIKGGNSILNNKKDKKGSRGSDTYLDPNIFRDEHFNRPKIPIPDNKKENNNNRSFDDQPSSERKSSIASDVAVAAHQMATLILSPIKETDISRKSSPQKPNGDISKQVNLQFNVQSAQVPNSFVILPTSNGVINNSSVNTISATIPLTLSTVPEHTGNGAIITELPLDYLDSAEFQSTNEKLVHSVNSYKHRTLENTRSTPPSMSSSLSTYSSQSSQPRVLQRTTSAPKKSEVYV